MNTANMFRMSSRLLAFAIGLGAAGAAQADYFVRPVLQYGGSTVDGLKLNGDSSNSLTFNDGATSLEAHVDLADGTIKTYVSRNGPSDEFTGATGVIGEQIRYTGDSDVAVSLFYDFSADVSAFFESYDTDPDFDNRFIAIDAYFAVYEAGSGANWKSWTVVSPFASQAIYNDRDFQMFQDDGDDLSFTYNGTLGADLKLESGKYYDVFAAFNLLVTPGAKQGWVTMDSLHTSTISISAPGGTITSQSGEFLGFAQSPAAVPEPASWALMICGLGITGCAMRRRQVVRVAV